MDGQIEEVPPSVGVISAELSTMSGWLTGPPPGSRMSSTGTTISRSSSFERPASTSSISRPPDTKRPISSSGRWVADRPIRCSGFSTSRSSRSTEMARCAPRFVPATA